MRLTSTLLTTTAETANLPKAPRKCGAIFLKGITMKLPWCDRFTVGEVGVLLTLIAACEGASIQPACRMWLATAKAKLEEQKRLLGD